MKDNNPSLKNDTVIVEQYRYFDNYLLFTSYNKTQISNYGVFRDTAKLYTIALFYEKGKRPLLGYEANKIKIKL